MKLVLWPSVLARSSLVVPTNNKNPSVALPLSSFSLSCGCCKQPLEFTDKNCSPRQCFAASLRRNYCRGLSNASRLRVCYSNHPSWIKGADLLDPPSLFPLFLHIPHCLLLLFPFLLHLLHLHISSPLPVSSSPTIVHRDSWAHN